MKNNLLVILSGLSSVGVLFLIYQQNVVLPNKLKECSSLAITFEKARHYPVDDLTVTNQDISSYMKNIVGCIVD